MSKYKRILLKLSGEALASTENTVDPDTLSKVVNIIQSALDQKVEVGIVVGGVIFLEVQHLPRLA
jgi:uridylate kinase